MNCSICPRKCNADRENSVGFCKSPAEFRLARAALHFWEEPCISGENGSGTVFFSGCNLKCVYCQNYEISIENKGIVVDDSRLIEIFKSLIEQGAENINLVNPTHYADRLANLFEKWHCPVPVVYNTSGYESAQTLKMLDGIVDIYLTDFKYIRPDKAQKYSNAPDYPEVAKNALAEMKRQVQGYAFDSRSVMQKGVIVRHLVLPQNTNSALRIIDIILPKITVIHILALWRSMCRVAVLKITLKSTEKSLSVNITRSLIMLCRRGLKMFLFNRRSLPRRSLFRHLILRGYCDNIKEKGEF